MSEDKAPASDARAVAVRTQYPQTYSPVAIWSSDDFAQMQRVAVVLTKSGLVPETLCKEGAEWLPEQVVAARCTLICNQARLWGADPLNVLQCTSLINGRLMYEGKLIAAVVASMTGVKLRYKFGVWDTDHITFPDDESGLHGAGDRLAVRCYDPEDSERYVDGSVGQWKTTRSGNPWSNSSAWPRQLRYRASREWARAYEPGVILGILADGDQDIDELAPQRATAGSGLAARLSGTQEGDGFNADDVAAQTGPKKRKTKAEKLAEEALAAADAAVDAEVEEIPQTDAPADATQPEGQSGSEPTETSPEASSEEPQSQDGTATTASPSEFAEVHAAPGEVYLLEGDGYNNDKRRVTYKDGVRFSTVHKDTSHKHTVYTVHAPTIAPPADDGIPEHMRDDVGATSMDGLKDELSGVEAYQEGDEVPEGVLDRPTSPEGSTVTEVAPPAEPEPATSEPVTAASGDGAPTAEDSGQSPPAVGEGLPPEYAEYVQALAAATTWAAVKKAMGAFYNTDFFKGLTPEKQNRVRANTWGDCVDSKAEGVLTDLPDHADDMTAFRLWIETVEDPDAIIGTKNILERQEQWAAELAHIQGSDQAKGNRAKALIANINNAVDARLRALS